MIVGLLVLTSVALIYVVTACFTVILLMPIWRGLT